MQGVPELLAAMPRPYRAAPGLGRYGRGPDDGRGQALRPKGNSYGVASVRGAAEAGGHLVLRFDLDLRGMPVVVSHVGVVSSEVRRSSSGSISSAPNAGSSSSLTRQYAADRVFVKPHSPSRAGAHLRAGGSGVGEDGHAEFTEPVHDTAADVEGVDHGYGPHSLTLGLLLALLLAVIRNGVDASLSRNRNAEEPRRSGALRGVAGSEEVGGCPLHKQGGCTGADRVRRAEGRAPQKGLDPPLGGLSAVDLGRCTLRHVAPSPEGMTRRKRATAQPRRCPAAEVRRWLSAFNVP